MSKTTKTSGGTAYIYSTARRPWSSDTAWRLALLARANEDLLVAANAALRELRRLDRMDRTRGRGPRPAGYRVYLRLKDALLQLDALDE